MRWTATLRKRGFARLLVRVIANVRSNEDADLNLDRNSTGAYYIGGLSALGRIRCGTLYGGDCGA